MSLAANAIERLKSARNYSSAMLADIEEDKWYRQPAEGVTNLVWQLGHLVVAEYRLGLERVRGRKPEDELLVPNSLMERYGKGSVPNSDPSQNATIPELLTLRDRVSQAVYEEVGKLSDAELLTPPFLQPHPMSQRKLGSLDWCANHELIHAGQIGLLRRLFGKAPLR